MNIRRMVKGLLWTRFRLLTLVLACLYAGPLIGLFVGLAPTADSPGGVLGIIRWVSWAVTVGIHGIYWWLLVLLTDMHLDCREDMGNIPADRTAGVLFPTLGAHVGVFGFPH